MDADDDDEALQAVLLASMQAEAAQVEAVRLRIRADQEGLDEITRVERQRGSDARAVQLGVFPDGG